jgi:hypothetical protein
MKRFLTKIAIFLVVAYMIALGLDAMISHGLDNSAGHPHQAWREMRSGNYASDIVIMGTSRALEHYDPYIIDSITGLQSYNLGMGGYGINVQLMKYKYYCQYNHLPKYLIYDVDYIPLVINHAPHKHQSEQFLPLFYDGAIRKDLMNVGYSWIDAYMPMARYWGYQTYSKRGLFECLNLKHYCVFPSYKGHTPDPDEWDLSRLQFTDSIPSNVDKEAKVLFRDFVQDCQKNGVQLIFVTSPVYYRYVEMSGEWNHYIAWYDSIAEANNIPYLNYTDDPMCRDSLMFNAGVHLTPQGTKIWSEILSNDLMEILK